MSELVAQLKECWYRVCVVGNVTDSSPARTINFCQYLPPHTVKGRSLILFSSPLRSKAYGDGQKKISHMSNKETHRLSYHSRKKII